MKDESDPDLNTPGLEPGPSGLKSCAVPLDQAHRATWVKLMCTTFFFRMNLSEVTVLLPISARTAQG